MKKRQRAIMNMADTFDAELTDDSAIYTGNKQFEDGVAAFRARKLISVAAMKAAYPDDLSFSNEKLTAKIKLAIKFSILCGLAYVELKKKGQLSLAESLSCNKSEYTHLPDLDCATLAEAMHKVLLDNIELIDIPSITIEILTELLKQIEAFKSLQGTSSKENKTSPVLTKAFDDTLPPLLESVEDLKKLVGFYFETKPDFYARVMATSAIPTVHVIHTYIIITAILKSTGKPAVGILFALEKAKKTGITDRNGILKFNEARSGEDILTAYFEGKEILNNKVSIKRSTTNEWEVVIEGM